jgi:methylamine dehydrogenase accessory protein MauD
MTIALLVSSILLWLLVLFLGFVLLGALRTIALLQWELDELRATTPSRLGRMGLRPGKKAPVFTLPSLAGPEVDLADYVGRKLLLVFVQSGCGPCTAVVPDLNQLHRDGKHEVLVVNNAAPDKARQWVTEHDVKFPVLIQEKYAVSKRYEVLATPFGFLIDEKGIIRSKGIMNSKEQIGFVVNGRGCGAKAEHDEPEPPEAAVGLSESSESNSNAKEVQHV